MKEDPIILTPHTVNRWTHFPGHSGQNIQKGPEKEALPLLYRKRNGVGDLESYLSIIRIGLDLVRQRHRQPDSWWSEQQSNNCSHIRFVEANAISPAKSFLESKRRGHWKRARGPLKPYSSSSSTPPGKVSIIVCLHPNSHPIPFNFSPPPPAGPRPPRPPNLYSIFFSETQFLSWSIDCVRGKTWRNRNWKLDWETDEGRKDGRKGGREAFLLLRR